MLNEGENLNKELRGQDKATYLDTIEVGANDVIQAREIASHGSNAHSFEPSRCFQQQNCGRQNMIKFVLKALKKKAN